MKRPILWHEISAALVLKALLLWGLWWLCFSHPIDNTLSPSKIAGHLITPNMEDNHAS